MIHDDAFLEDIARNPADDTPRLIYADWLDEHGGAAEAARAAFIRAQCLLAQLELLDPRRLALQEECADLLAEHGVAWSAPVRDIARRWEFQRGFIDCIEVRDEDLFQHAPTLLGRLPVRSLVVHLQASNGEALGKCPHLARLERLEVRGYLLRDRAVQPVLASPHLKGLTSLGLADNELETPAIRSLLEGGLLSRLRRLDLSNNRSLGDRAVALLVGSPQAERLESLNLSRTNITTWGLREVFAATPLGHLAELGVGSGNYQDHLKVDTRALLGDLADTPLLRRLVSLDFSGWMDGDRSSLLVPFLQATRLSELHLLGLNNAAVIRDLVALPELGSLTTLDLAGSDMDAEGAAALAQSPHLSKLTVLSLSQSPMSDKGAAALASSPHLHQLTGLDLQACALGGPGIKALAQSRNLEHLRWLSLAGNRVNAASVNQLAHSTSLRHLTSLDLADCRLETDSAEALAGSRKLGRLERLRLDGNDLENKGAAALAGSPTLKRLKQLGLRNNRVGKQGAEALAASRHLNQLTWLDVRENYLTDTEINLLRARFGSGVCHDEERAESRS